MDMVVYINSYDCLSSILEGFCNLKKLKLKHKGKKVYKNTHGSIYRVVRNYKLTRLIQRRKAQRKLAAQLST